MGKYLLASSVHGDALAERNAPELGLKSEWFVAGLGGCAGGGGGAAAVAVA